MATPLHVTRRTFLTNLKRSGLLTREQYLEAKQTAPDTERGRLLARSLVEKGVLTRFQAERLLIGRTSGFHLDQYVILEELGRGGMGRVYKAQHRTMGRFVALKILAHDLTQSERAQEMFLREVRAVAQLVHPNIVAAYDANKAGDRYYLVLEYVDGPNLDQLVKARGPLSVGQACDFIRQSAQGLQAAYTLGMVHRDMKPANILVQRRAADGSPGLVKISDFGLARLADSALGANAAETILAKPGTVMGTPDFLSPEQARNLHRTDIRSDIYSLGCTFYYLLTGQVPFPAGTSMEKLIRHSSVEPTPVEALKPEIPPEIAEILRKMMAKKPEDRHQTPGELAAVLEPYSVSGPTPWEPVRQTLDPHLDEPMPAELGGAPDPSPSGEIALDGTHAAAADLTPLSDTYMPRRPVGRQSRSRLWKRLVWGLLLGVLAGAAAAAAWIALHPE